VAFLSLGSFASHPPTPGTPQRRYTTMALHRYDEMFWFMAHE
jgi:hypothetical protein